jgi:hypothetical protein
MTGGTALLPMAWTPQNTEVHCPKGENTLEKGINIPILCRKYTMFVCIIWVGSAVPLPFHPHNCSKISS